MTLEGVQFSKSSEREMAMSRLKGVADGAVAQGVVASSGHGKAATLEVLHDAGAVAAREMHAAWGGVPVDAVAAERDHVAAVVLQIHKEGDEFVAAVGIGFERV